MIHAGADDNMTDPAGNAGARIACGVITNRETAKEEFNQEVYAPKIAPGG